MSTGAVARPLWRTLFLASLIAGAYLLFLPSPPDAPMFPQADKLVHAAIFGAPSLTGLIAGLPRRGLVIGLALYAVASEVVQHVFLSDRGGDPRDVAADLAGIALAVAFVAVHRWRTMRHGP